MLLAVEQSPSTDSPDMVFHKGRIMLFFL